MTLILPSHHFAHSSVINSIQSLYRSKIPSVLDQEKHHNSWTPHIISYFVNKGLNAEGGGMPQ